jgi:Domain of unknown function (DUF5710)
MATSRVAERLDAPRNKISGLTGVPPLRRFFNHPTDIPLREIIEARDILIVDANMGAIGTESSKACMLFILRMLHAQLQRQVHLPANERPRVPLMVDEAHYVAGGENVVDQIATHRAAGLEPAFGLQYFAQLGSASEHQQKILKGVLNLLQSRFLFRMGDPQDAEEAARIAMAVYATMIRDDPDSRARLRVTPEQLLNFPNYFCLASWIANGTRAPAFTGETYPLPDGDGEWAEHHLAAQAERVGPYPEQLESTLDAPAPAAEPGRNGHEPATPRPSRSPREYLAVPYDEKDTAKRLGARWDPNAQSWYIPAGVDPEPLGALAIGRPPADRRHSGLGERRRSRAGERAGRRAAGRWRRARQSGAERAPGQAGGAGRLRAAARATEPVQQPGPTSRRAPSTRQPETARGPSRSGHPSRARVPRPDQRSRPRRAAPRRRQAAAPLRPGLRDPRAPRPGRPRAPLDDRPRRLPRPVEHSGRGSGDEALPARANLKRSVNPAGGAGPGP